MTGNKINAGISSVEENWNKMQKIYANVGKSLRIYAEYLSEVLNDRAGAEEIINRANDGLNAQNNLVLSGSNNIIEDTACIIISGDEKKSWEISTFNMSACRLFGYSKNQLQSKKINYLMPDLYANVHDSFLQNALDTNNANNGQINNALIFAMAKHKSGYLLPVGKEVKSFSSVSEGIQLIATFKPERKSTTSTVGYILTDSANNVEGITSSITIRGLKMCFRLHWITWNHKQADSA